MKKAVIAASACFVAGLIGCTISLPMVAKDVIHLYNDTVSETANFYTTQDLPAGITEPENGKSGYDGDESGGGQTVSG